MTAYWATASLLAFWLAVIAVATSPGLRHRITGCANFWISCFLGTAWMLTHPGERHKRAGKAERNARAHLGMPAGHPEWLVGSDEAAARGDFPAWAAELEAEGMDAGTIIESYRRGL